VGRNFTTFVRFSSVKLLNLKDKEDSVQTERRSDMDMICIQCKKVFSIVTTIQENGNASGGICINCFIDYLVRRVNYLKLKEQTPSTTKSLIRNKKKLTLMLIKRQEGGV